MSQIDYYRHIKKLVEDKRLELITEHKGRWMSKAQLSQVVPGSKPRKIKKSRRQPLALGECAATLKEWFNWYFSKIQAFREASVKFRAGVIGVVFPEGMYPPPPPSTPLVI